MRAWPLSNSEEISATVHMTKAAARNFGIHEQYQSTPRVKLKKLVTDARSADRIILKPCMDKHVEYTKDLSFQSIVALTCRDSILAIGSICSVNYYGNTVDVYVVEIVESEKNESKSDKEISLLTDRLKFSASLMEDNANVITSTPRKQDLNIGIDKSFYYIGETTQIDFQRTAVSENIAQFEVNAREALNKIGGLDDELDLIRDTVQSVLTSSFRSYVGILLYGPSGTGKTMIGNSLQHIVGNDKVEYTQLNGGEIYSKYFGETETNLRSLLENGSSDVSKVVFIDDFDIICSKPKETGKSTDQDRRIVSTLRAIVDSMSMKANINAKKTMKKLVLVAASSMPDAIDPSFRRGGRLDVEIEISVPTAKNRRKILSKILHGMTSHGQVYGNLDDKVINSISDAAHGYVGADLLSLCSHAHSILASSLPSNQSGVVTECDEKQLKQAFESGLRNIRPSAMREVLVEVPDVTWEDIGGMNELKLLLKQAVQWPIQHADGFKKFNIKPPKGLLMYGPPGCSKTLIAKAFANESGLNFVSIKGPELFSKWVGESEEAVRALFRRARRVAPSIIFFDEIDALGSERGNAGGSKVGDRVLAQMLTEMDGVEGMGQVTILAATNRPDMIDNALLRPGRLDRIVYVPLPDHETRLEILKVHTKEKPLAQDIVLETLVELTKGYSGAEIAAVCNEAAIKALEEMVTCYASNLQASGDDSIKMKHFDIALSCIAPRITSESIEMYNAFKTKNH